MKKTTIMATVVACGLAFTLAGCGSSGVLGGTSSNKEVMSASDTSVTASEIAKESSSALSSSASAASTAAWSEAKDAKAAAAGAGIERFALPEKDVVLSIGTMMAKDWTYRYTDGIAEADGYAAAATVIVREGNKAGDCSTPLSDYIAGEWSALEGVEYEQAWTQTVEDIEVTCFGNKKGVASKMIWNEDQHGFSVQVLGQGDNWKNFGVEEKDVEKLVGAIIKANADPADQEKSKKSADSEKASAEAQEDDQATSARDYAEALVWQNGLGELVSFNNIQDDDGTWVLEVITRGADGNEYRSVIGADGTVLESEFGDINADADEAEEDANGANAEGDDEGDNDGVKKYSNTEAKQAVEDNDLGTYMYSQEVQGADGKIYQEITTRDEDGNDSYSYLDSNGNVTYDVDVELRYNNDGSATPNKNK